MDKDNDWVDAVKRWCRAGGASTQATTSSALQIEDDGASFGYEAANPSVQARHWPESFTAFPTGPLNR